MMSRRVNSSLHGLTIDGIEVIDWRDAWKDRLTGRMAEAVAE
jgi:hypothetical protein